MNGRKRKTMMAPTKRDDRKCKGIGEVKENRTRGHERCKHCLHGRVGAEIDGSMSVGREKVGALELQHKNEQKIIFRQRKRGQKQEKKGTRELDINKGERRGKGLELKKGGNAKRMLTTRTRGR